MNKLELLLCALLPLAPSAALAQMEKSIKINEVMTDNASGLQDDYGQCLPWIEIANVSYSTYDISGMYLTTDRAVLDKSMSVAERMKHMSIISDENTETSMSARKHILFFCNSNPAKGAQHVAVDMKPGKPVWVALYNGNAVDLVDSVTVPALAPGTSFARLHDGSGKWIVKPADAVTPGISNYTQANETKIDKLKREDPHGFGITVLSMGIVFSCLALLFIFFSVFSVFMKNREMAEKVAQMQPFKAGVKTVEKTSEIGHKTSVILQEGLKSKGIDREVYVAVIAMALHEYQMNVHDVESGVITIKPKQTDWNIEYIQMTRFHE